MFAVAVRGEGGVWRQLLGVGGGGEVQKGS